MSVGGEVAHGHVAIGGPLDAAGAEDAVGVAVEEQGQHGVGRILGVAGALVVHGEGGQGQAVHGLDDEVDEVILGHPVAQVRRQQERGVTVGVLEAMGHSCQERSSRPAVYSTIPLLL